MPYVIHLPPSVAAEVLHITGDAASRIDVCPIVAGSRVAASFQFYLGGERVRHIDAFSSAGKALGRMLVDSQLWS